MMSGITDIIEVFTLFTPAELIGIDLKGSTVVVIDVLRGSSTIIYALKHGANRVFPAAEIEEARAVADEWPTGEYLLCAERNGIKVDGFNLGNSPFEYDPSVVAGKDIIYSSTNCSKALIASSLADRVLIGTFNNNSAVVDAIETPGRIFLLCAGKMGRFAIEDAVCAGMFVNELLKQRRHEAAFNDGSRTARILFDYYHRDILALLKECSHGSYLSSIGHGKDLELAAMVDSERIVPELSLDKRYFFSTFLPRLNDDAVSKILGSRDTSFNETSLAVDPDFEDFEVSEVSDDQ
jgi:2-phosphosulfolactate phosphatase